MATQNKRRKNVKNVKRKKVCFLSTLLAVGINNFDPILYAFCTQIDQF